MMFYDTPSKIANDLPSCPSSGWGRRVFYSTTGYRLSRLMLWWRIRRTPSTGGSYRTGASSQRSRPVPRPVVERVDYLVALLGPFHMQGS